MVQHETGTITVASFEGEEGAWGQGVHEGSRSWIRQANRLTAGASRKDTPLPTPRFHPRETVAPQNCQIINLCFKH